MKNYSSKKYKKIKSIAQVRLEAMLKKQQKKKEDEEDKDEEKNEEAEEDEKENFSKKIDEY